MKHHNAIEKRAEEMLNSLDGIQRAIPKPWFFARVKARLAREEKMNAWEIVSSYLARPSVAIAGLTLILVMNGVFLFIRDTENTAVISSVQNEQAYTDSESLMASSSSFDYENLVQP